MSAPTSYPPWWRWCGETVHSQWPLHAPESIAFEEQRSRMVADLAAAPSHPLLLASLRLALVVGWSIVDLRPTQLTRSGSHAYSLAQLLKKSKSNLEAWLRMVQTEEKSLFIAWRAHCSYLLMSIEVNPQVNRITVVAFTQKYSGYRISIGNGCICSS
jgi:hypothetical protein